MKEGWPHLKACPGGHRLQVTTAGYVKDLCEANEVTVSKVLSLSKVFLIACPSRVLQSQQQSGYLVKNQDNQPEGRSDQSRHV